MRQKIEDFGQIFRFLTPILIAFVGFVTIKYLTSIDVQFASINRKFDVFIESYHSMDKRVIRLEDRVFGERARE